MSETISVVIADDQALVREAIASRLHSETDIRIVGLAADADAAYDIAAETRPDIVLLDIDMPGRSAFDTADRIRRHLPETHVVFLSAHKHDQYIELALNAGAAGYLTKGEPVDTVIAAIRIVATGRTYFSPEVRNRLVIDVDGAHLKPGRSTRLSTLTPREHEVLVYIARGMTKKKVATTINLSVKTVENHAANVMSKLDIHDRVGLARFAIREGLTDP